MNILGVGGAELVAILLIMLIVAGPKRMIRWSYVLGTYIAKLRRMWAEAAAVIQKEFDEAGVDIQVPRDVPTRQTLNREIQKTFSPVTQPIQQALDETKTAASIPKITAQNGHPKSPAASAPDKTGRGSDFGSWSGGGTKPESGFGSWSGLNDESEDEA